MPAVFARFAHSQHISIRKVAPYKTRKIDIGPMLVKMLTRYFSPNTQQVCVTKLRHAGGEIRLLD